MQIVRFYVIERSSNLYKPTSLTSTYYICRFSFTKSIYTHSRIIEIIFVISIVVVVIVISNVVIVIVISIVVIVIVICIVVVVIVISIVVIVIVISIVVIIVNVISIVVIVQLKSLQANIADFDIAIEEHNEDEYFKRLEQELSIGNSYDVLHNK
jgi:energy-coupling factor transporter transmembrane protein EcfT